MNNATIDEYREAYKHFNKIISSMAKVCELSDTEYWAMELLREGVTTQQEICEQLFISKQTINSAFKKLVKKGFVKLEPMEDNLRKKKITFTEKGTEFAEKYIDPMIEMEERTWYEMKEDERKLLISLTRKYSAITEKALAEYEKNQKRR